MIDCNLQRDLKMVTQKGHLVQKNSKTQSKIWDEKQKQFFVRIARSLSALWSVRLRNTKVVTYRAIWNPTKDFFLKVYVSPRDDCNLPVGPVPRPCSYYSEKVFLFDSNGQQWPPWRGAWCCYFRRIVLLCVGWPAARPEVSCSYPGIVHIGCDKRPRASLIFLIDPLHSQWVKKVVRAVLRPLNDKPGRFDIDFYNTRPGL